MGALTEVEIFGVLSENFRKSAENCEKLAWHPFRGPVYREFVKQIKLVEGAAMQASTWREDTRWLVISLQMGEVHKRCGHWMRNSKTKDERKEADKRFKKLADCLRKFAYEAEDMRTRATGKLGMILPEPLPAAHRDARPVQVITPGGIILPLGTVLH